MTIPAWFAKIDGVLDGINARLAAFGDHASKISALTVERDAFKARAEKAEASIAEADAKIQAADKLAADRETEAKAALAKVTALESAEQDIEKRASAKALEIVAKQGSTVPLGSKPGAGTAKAVYVGPDGKPLSGIDLAKAAHAAEVAAASAYK